MQLSTTHNISFALPPAIISAPSNTAASKIVALIEDEEGKYQISLNETYQEMGEKTFKGLRRALPLTRQKIDWDKVRDGFVILLKGLMICVQGFGIQAWSRAVIEQRDVW